MTSVLVTGSTGNVGAEVARRLVARGATVTCAVRAGRSRHTTQGATSVVFDLEDPCTYATALEGVEKVFLVRPPHMSDPAAFRPFIAAMAAAGVRHVVFLSVQGAGGNVFVPHNGIERLLRRSGVAWTFVRPSFFMQNLTTTHLAEIRDRDEIFVPAGDGRTNFIDVADVAEAATVCLTAPGHERRAYEVTGSEALSYHEVAAVLSEACGRSIVYRRPTSKEFAERMLADGHPRDFVKVTSRIYAVARFGMAAGTTDTFERLVGRRPVTLREWAAANAACWQGKSERTGDGERAAGEASVDASRRLA